MNNITSGPLTAEQLVADALNRLADATFQMAKQQKRTANAAEKSAIIAERMCQMQETNLNVTRELEMALAQASRGGAVAQ